MNDAEYYAAIKEYIEEMEEQVEGEWGSCRSLQELVAAGNMPSVWHETMRRLYQV